MISKIKNKKGRADVLTILLIILIIYFIGKGLGWW